MSRPRPLSGLRVLEMADGPAGGFCGRQFVRWGADVVILEPPGGGALRRAAPVWRKDAETGSIPFEFLAVGKRSVEIGADALADIASLADLLICDSGQSGLAELQASHPHLIVVRITPYGPYGPRAGEAGGALDWQSLSGYLSLNGPTDGPPIAAPARILEHAVGANAFVGAMAALIARRRSGVGGVVDISGLETVAALVPYLREQHQGFTTRRSGGTPEGARLLRCLDGFISVAPAILPHLPAYREVLGIPVAEAPDSLITGDRRLDVEAMSSVFAPYLARLSVQEVFLGLQVRGVVCGVVQDAAAVLADPQLDARHFYSVLDHPMAGPVPLAGPAARIGDDAPTSIRSAPAPGSTTRDAIGWNRRPSVGPPRHADRGPPLRGFTVLDLTQAWIGPMAGVILGDLGADVIKVEGVGRPDIWRHLGQAPPSPGLAPTSPLNRSWYFNSANRNKQGLGLDLTSPAGRDIFLRLVGQADVVLENFTPHVMARFGLDYDVLSDRRPELVCTAFNGFGADGPFATFKANGASIEALAGWDALHRDAAGDPVLMATYPADPTGGLQMAAATLVALYRRLTEGGGAHVDGSMLEASAEHIGDVLLAEAFRQAGVAVEDEPDPPASAGDRAVLTPLEALDEPQLRDWFVTLDSPGLGRSRHPGFLWRFSGTTLAAPTPPPKLGQHTEVLLRQRLGLDAADIARLAADGVVGSEA